MEAVLATCRASFESDLAAELTRRAEGLEVAGFCRARPAAGWVVFQAHDPAGARRVVEATRVVDLIFARQLILAAGPLENLPAGDRVAPLVGALEGLGQPLAEVFVEHPDTEDGKPLSGLARKLARPLDAALSERGLRGPDDAAHRGHVLLLDGATAWVGVSRLEGGNPWPMGIPRLRLPRAAPSRSARKLEEALLVFLTEEQRARWLREGLTAVDLGAAPGGWSWVLARRGLFVTAVDKARLAEGLTGDGQITHLQADGFHYRPDRPVDWLVCDMVEKPARIADLVAGWLADGLCRRSIFNLKLPMKKRLAEVDRCADRLRAAVAGRLRVKHLYHDREEVTACFLAGEG